MPDFSLEDLAPPVAAASPNFAIKVAAGALVFGCGLYRDYPGAVVGQNPSPFLKGLMDTLCDDRPPGLPPPPSSPFVGGQCLGIGYGFTTSSPFVNQSLPSGLVPNTSQTPPLWGRVTGFNPVPHRGRFDNWYVSVTCAADSSSPNQINREVEVGLFSEASPVIGSLQRFDSQPDTCGDPPSSYPISVIPDDRKVGSLTNIYNDGANFTVPLIYTPLSISAPLTINVGGVNFKFDFGGLTIGDGDGLSDVVNNIAGSVTKISNDTDVIRNDIDIVRNDTDVINSTVNRTEESVVNIAGTISVVNTLVTNAPIPPESIEEEPPNDEPEREDIDNMFAVRVELTTIPINAKMQFGIAAPNVLYAGWFEFKRGTYAYPREPIAFQEGIFKAPMGADGYAYTLYVGYAGEATVIKLKPPVDS